MHFASVNSQVLVSQPAGQGFNMILAGDLDHVKGPYFDFKGGIEEVTAHCDHDSNKGK